MLKVTYFTEEGLQKLKQELDVLQNFERPSISKQIAEARDKGDLSENAEYHASKEAQGMLELKISKLQETIRSARIIDESKINSDTVQILRKVKIQNRKTKSVVAYEIVPENEANIKAGKISVDSPIARGLLGKKVGQQALVHVPSGDIEFEILEIA